MATSPPAASEEHTTGKHPDRRDGQVGHGDLVHRPVRAVRPTGLTALNLSARRTDQAAARSVTWDLVTSKVAASTGFLT